MQILPAQLLAESTSDVVASYLRQYTVGRKSWLDVLNAQRELVQAKYALVEYEVRLIMASYKMKILVGNIRRDTVMAQSE
jgi:adhesin transport system outer membrane protein